MILKSLKSNYSYLVILIVLFNLLFFSIYFIDLDNQKITASYILPNILSLILVCLFITLQSIGLNNLIYEKDVIKKPNVVLAFIFILLNTTLNVNLQMTFFSFLLLFFLYYLLILYKQKNTSPIVFNASLILSVISTLNFPEILFLTPLIFISMIVFRNLQWQSLFVCSLGLITPYIFMWFYQYLFNKNLYFPVFQIKFLSFEYKNLIHIYSKMPLSEKIWAFILIIIIVSSFIELASWIKKKSIKSRESFTIIMFYLATTIFIFLFNHNKINISLSVTPISIIISNFFIYSKKKTICEFMFIIFLFASIFYRISIINV